VRVVVGLQEVGKAVDGLSDKRLALQVTRILDSPAAEQRSLKWEMRIQIQCVEKEIRIKFITNTPDNMHLGPRAARMDWRGLPLGVFRAGVRGAG